MALIKMKITYGDGREPEVVAVTPRARLATERYVGGYKADNSTLASYYAVWWVLNNSGKESLGFEPWLDQIEDVEDYEDEAPVPTPPAPSEDGSSESAL